MKALNLLLTLLMVYALKLCSKFHYVNAEIPKDIYFPNNNFKVVNKKLFSSEETFDLSSCRFNNGNVSIYCEFKKNGDIYRLKVSIYGVEYEKDKNKDDKNCNIHNSNLENKNGLFYFKAATAVKQVLGVFSWYSGFEGNHDVDIGENKIELVTSDNCKSTYTYNMFTIYKV